MSSPMAESSAPTASPARSPEPCVAMASRKNAGLSSMTRSTPCTTARRRSTGSSPPSGCSDSSSCSWPYMRCRHERSSSSRPEK